jgi:RNA recognition motif-containing protein
MRIFVGNLNYTTDGSGLRSAFERFGDVTDANVVMDRDSNRSRGFGFVEMPAKEQAEAAIRGLNGQDLDGRSVTVNESRPKTQSNARRW